MSYYGLEFRSSCVSEFISKDIFLYHILMTSKFGLVSVCHLPGCNQTTKKMM